MFSSDTVSPYRGMRVVASFGARRDASQCETILKNDQDTEVRFCPGYAKCCEALREILPDILVTAENAEQILAEPALADWRPVVVQMVQEGARNATSISSEFLYSHGSTDLEECMAAAKVAVLGAKLQDLATLSGLYLRTGPYRRFSNRLVAYCDSNARVEVPVAEIFMVTAAGNYLSIETERGQLRMRETLENLETRLDPEMFTRVHRSILVNRAHVRGFVDEDRSPLIHLANGQAIAVGPKYRRNVELLRSA